MYHTASHAVKLDVRYRVSHRWGMATFERPPREKSELLPPVRVEPERKARYVQAWEAWREGQGPHAVRSFAEWMRAVLDAGSTLVAARSAPAGRGRGQ